MKQSITLLFLFALMSSGFKTGYAMEQFCYTQMFEAVHDASWNRVEDILHTFQPGRDGDINTFVDKKYTLLHYACLAGNIDIVKLLMNKGARPNITVNSCDIYYNYAQKKWENITDSPLHCAAIAGSCEIIDELLNDKGVKINDTYEEYGNTPLHLAVWFGHPDCVQLLINRGASMNIANKPGSTPVHLAAWRNEPECLAILLYNGAEYQQKNNTGLGNTPMYLAAKAGAFKCLGMLIDHCGKNQATINQLCSGTGGSTALRVAAELVRIECCWELIQAGATLPEKLDVDFKPLQNFFRTVFLRFLM